MGGAVLDRALQVAVLQESVDQAGGEAVAAADAVEDLQPGPGGRLDEARLPRPGDRRPVVDGRAANRAQRRGDDR